jgi:hypothetical protein
MFWPGISAGQDLLGGTNTPFSIWLVAQVLTTGSTKTMLGFQRNAINTAGFKLEMTAGPVWSCTKSDGTTVKQITGGTPDTGIHRFQYNDTGTAGELFVDDVSTVTGATNVSAITSIVTGSIGGLHNSANGQYTNMRAALLILAKNPTTQQKSDISAYVRSRGYN